MIFPSTGLNPLKSCFRFNVRLNRFLGPNSSLPCFGPFQCIVDGWKQKVCALVIIHCMATNCINYNTTVAKIACIK